MWLRTQTVTSLKITHYFLLELFFLFFSIRYVPFLLFLLRIYLFTS
uniref:ORF45 n=1 Tax=Euplotes crassus TaxID=5936 RepID=D1LDS9_EUPCR|nr:ORF45 [Moneuplotes crassus]